MLEWMQLMENICIKNMGVYHSLKKETSTVFLKKPFLVIRVFKPHSPCIFMSRRQKERDIELKFCSKLSFTLIFKPLLLQAKRKRY